ncbi:MAG: hypothetical protein JXR83_02650 [Deltaproteobacteria bacterium]|nr:hypothetical protein [Deltaproteobacteria bacterium]
MSSNAYRSLAIAVLLALARCGCEPESDVPPRPIGDGFVAVTAVNETTVIVSFSRAIDRATVQPERFGITCFTVLPAVPFAVIDAHPSGDAEVTLTTARQERGQLYTLSVTGVNDRDGYPLDGTVNFVGAGERLLAAVTLAVDDLERATAFGRLNARVTVDADGNFRAGYRELTLEPDGDRWAVRLSVAVDRNRTVDRSDDGDLAIDRRAYGVRLVDGAGQPASPLVLFEVLGGDPMTVTIPLLDPLRQCPDAPYPPLTLPAVPVDPVPGDGVKRVRIVVDDRQPRELIAPALAVTADDQGNFTTLDRNLDLDDSDGDGIYQAEVDLKVDPRRVNTDIENAPIDEIPYLAFLVNNGSKLADFYIFITALDEEPANAVMPLGDPDLTPVTFRIDVGASYVTGDGSVRGHHPGEAIFVTGNFSNIVDAFRQNCGDAWSGGENLNLRMRERSDHPGIWEKTLWLPRGRAQTYKVVRCDADLGCGPLNASVTSTGFAFATVMKNLATENLDASNHAAVKIIDPNQPSVVINGTSYDYSGADIYVGTGIGREEDPPDTPDASLLFKQEIPNLVVSPPASGECALQTPVEIIGTWRDVNLPLTPAQIIQAVGPTDPKFNLNPYDYDDGMVGVAAPNREAP